MIILTNENLTRENKEAGLEIIKINIELLERDNIYFLKPKNQLRSNTEFYTACPDLSGEFHGFKQCNSV